MTFAFWPAWGRNPKLLPEAGPPSPPGAVTSNKPCSMVARGAVARGIFCLLLAALLGTGLGSCAHPPVGLANCYEDLPLAEAALNAPKSNYVFKGVQLIKPAEMARLVRRRFPHNPSSSYSPPPVGSAVCAFAFTGNFPAGQVASAPPNVSGKAAVVLTTTGRRLLFSFVLARLPESFSRAVRVP